MEIGFYHPDRGYWQAIDVSKEPYYIIITPESIGIDDEGNEYLIPAVKEKTSQYDQLMASYPEGTIEVPLPPSADHQFIDGKWVYVEPPVIIPDRISARQFRMQLCIEDKKTPGFYQAVVDWVHTQDKLVQDSFEYSGSFVRTEPMMLSGFLTLGFDEERVKQFFLDASKLGAE